MTWLLSTLIIAAALAVWPFGSDEPEDTQSPKTQSPTPPGPPQPAPDPPQQLGAEPAGIDEIVDFAERGIELIMLGKPERAAESFRRALQRNPKDATVLYNLALALEESGRPDEACEAYSEAVESAPEAVDIRVNYGVALLNSGAVAGAIEQFSRAVALAPDDPAVHYNLGCAYQRSGDFYEAVSCFRQALRLDPQDVQCRFNLAVCLSELGHKELTIRELKLFIAQASDSYPEQAESASRMLAAVISA